MSEERQPVAFAEPVVNRDGILILGGREIAELLAGREEVITDLVARAYIAHNREQSSLPHSLFLRFPGNDLDRIIALPAFPWRRFRHRGRQVDLLVPPEPAP